jgi:hypothetical protein
MNLIYRAKMLKNMTMKMKETMKKMKREEMKIMTMIFMMSWMNTLRAKKGRNPSMKMNTVRYCR